MSSDFSAEQKRYLEGFVSGVQASRAAQGLAGVGKGAAAPEPTGPDAAHLKAQARFEAAGNKLVDQEKAKREEHPFDAYGRDRAGRARRARSPSRRRQFPLALSTGCSTSRRRRTPTCAGCGSRTAS